MSRKEYVGELGPVDAGSNSMTYETALVRMPGGEYRRVVINCYVIEEDFLSDAPPVKKPVVEIPGHRILEGVDGSYTAVRL